MSPGLSLVFAIGWAAYGVVVCTMYTHLSYSEWLAMMAGVNATFELLQWRDNR